MGLFTRRVRPRHQILINVDLAIQDCQREIDESEKELKKSVAHDKGEFGGTGVVKSGTSSSHYYQLEKSFGKLKERLLKNIKDIDKEMTKWENASAAATGISSPRRRK